MYSQSWKRLNMEGSSSSNSIFCSKDFVGSKGQYRGGVHVCRVDKLGFNFTHLFVTATESSSEIRACVGKKPFMDVKHGHFGSNFNLDHGVQRVPIPKYVN